MPLLFIAAVALIFLVLCASEFWWRKRKPDSELSRKFIHLSVGSFVAFWPFFLSWTEIRLLSLSFVIVVLISKWLKIFQAIHSVQRPTQGEIYFALVVGLLTFVTHSKGIYAAGLLQMSLADGLAAVVGVRYGKKQRYNVFHHPKSVIGTLTFFVISFVLLIGYSTLSTAISPGCLIGLSIGATALENLAVGGLDNLLVPFLVALVLSHVR
jgi:phytol kinase